MQIRSSRSHRPSARLSWLACAASTSSLISAVAVVNRCPSALAARGDAQSRGQVGLSRPGLADQQNRLCLGHVIALGQRAQLRGRDAGTVEFERIQCLHPRQSCLVKQPSNGPALTLFHLSRQQCFKIADMGLSLSGGGPGQPGKLTADRRHPERLAVLADGLVLEIAHYAVPTHGVERSSVS